MSKRFPFHGPLLASFLAIASLASAAPEAVPSTASSPAGTLETKAQGGPGYKFNALLQAWSVSDNTSGAAANLNFRLRRAELKLSGNVAPEMRYFVMADPAKAINPQGDAKVLQDLGIGVTVAPGLEVVAGQFKILTSAEGLSSSAELLLPERSVTSRFYGDRREPGLMISYQSGDYKVAAMASNGQGSNTDSAKTVKDLSLRADVNVTKELTAGAFVLLGDFEYAKRGSFGVNARVSPMRDLSVGAELDAGRVNGINNAGLVADIAYLMTREIQAVVRHELFKPNTAKGDVAQQSSVGVNYLLAKHNAKLQAALGYLSNLKGENGSPKTLTVGANGPLATLVFQAAL